MSLRRLSKLPAVLGVAALLSTAAFAASHISDEVSGAMKARKSHMQLYAFRLSTLGGMAQDKIPYDAAVASVAAADLAALASLSQAGYWVEGSDSSVEGSRALPEIWSDMAGFETKQQELVAAATVLASAAGTDLDSLKAAFGPVGGACGACHKAYRVADN